MLPTAHSSAVFGEVTVMVGWLMVKFTLLVSVAAGFAVHVTRTRPCVVAGPVTTQLYVLEVVRLLFTEAVISSQVVPPSRLNSIWK